AEDGIRDLYVTGVQTCALPISPTKTVSDPSFRGAIAGVERTLRADGAVSTVLAPTAGVSISRDGHTGIVQAGAARESNAMVQAAIGRASYRESVSRMGGGDLGI